MCIILIYKTLNINIDKIVIYYYLKVLEIWNPVKKKKKPYFIEWFNIFQKYILGITLTKAVYKSK